jgi:hypothetical protein
MMIEIVKALSLKGPYQEIELSMGEYLALLDDLYNADEFLQKKYDHAGAVPRIYSLFGVKIIIK